MPAKNISFKYPIPTPWHFRYEKKNFIRIKNSGHSYVDVKFECICVQSQRIFILFHSTTADA
jgi:hypothetical protein